MKNVTVKNMNELVEAIKIAYNNDNLEYFGIRTMSTEDCANVGDFLPDSYEYDHEQDTSRYFIDEKRLNGTCSTYVDTGSLWLDGSDDAELKEEVEKTMKIQRSYMSNGNQVVLIAGDGMEDGEDLHEAIIKNAKVIAIVNIEA